MNIEFFKNKFKLKNLAIKSTAMFILLCAAGLNTKNKFDLNKIYARENLEYRQSKKSKPKIKNINFQETKLDEYIYNLLKKNYTPEEIADKFFKLPTNKRSKLVGNMMKYKERQKYKNITNSERSNRNKTLKLINERQSKKMDNIVKKTIENEIIKENYDNIDKLKEVVYIAPGRGFEDYGGKVKDKKNNKIVYEKLLNAKLSRAVIKNLLNKGFTVFVTCDTEKQLKGLKKHSNLHILLKEDSRPEFIGKGHSCRIADANALAIGSTIKAVKKYNKNGEVCVVNIHHNSSPNKEDRGVYISYENTKKTSKNFVMKSKKFSKILLKHINKLKDVTHMPKEYNKIIIEDWVFCHFGDGDEKRKKEYDNAMAVLLENNYMTNPKILKYLQNPIVIENTAKAISDAICEYFELIQYEK